MDLYSDVNLYVHKVNSYELVFNEYSVNQSIMTILGTLKETRIFRPEFGSSLHRLLFDPIDNSTAFRIKSIIIREIERWEPRVKLNHVQVLPDYSNQQYYVTINYSIPELENKNASFSFNLNRIDQ